MREGFHLILLAVLFLLAAFFAGSETALFSLTRLERRRILERHPHVGRSVNDLLTHPRRALVTLLIGNNIVHTCAAAIATLMILRIFGPQGLGPAIALFTVVLVFVGEMIPKVFAVRNNELIALSTAPLLRAISVILFPLRQVVQWISDWVLSFFVRGRKEPSQLLSAQELKVLVKIGEEEGILDRQERRMIQKLFELGERPVRAIMTPRTDLAALCRGDSWEKQLQVMKSFHFSYFPVFEESLDQITGVVSTHEVILSGERDLQRSLRPVMTVPESKRIDELLRDFQKTGDRFVVCVDEFGGTAGVVTLEDILEEIFGEFFDEYAEPGQPIRELGGREYLVDPKISLNRFNEFFQSRLRSKEAETLGGFILEKMGRIPRKNDGLELTDFTFQIQDMARQRILKIRVKSKR